MAVHNTRRDSMNNEISSTSQIYRCKDLQSDNESRPRIVKKAHYKSMGNINDRNYDCDLRRIQNSTSTIDLSLHNDELQNYQAVQVPIVGYEVMEERARFTIYKLKVDSDKADQSWLVFRRYTDFVRLYSRIRAEQPTVTLPLPGKRWFKDNFDPIFLEERVRGLQVFVNAVLQKLPNNQSVRAFFCLDEPPTVFSYQPEVQAVYGALEDSIINLKSQLQVKESKIVNLQQRITELESQMKGCMNCKGSL